MSDRSSWSRDWFPIDRSTRRSHRNEILQQRRRLLRPPLSSRRVRGELVGLDEENATAKHLIIDRRHVDVGAELVAALEVALHHWTVVALVLVMTVNEELVAACLDL